MNKRLSALAFFVVGAASALTDPAPAQQFIHLDARVNSPSVPVVISLPAGCYRLTHVGPSAGGLFTAWHAWNGNNAGCDPQGLGCTQGWATLFWMHSPTTGGMFRGAGFFSTQALALANSPPSTFWLAQTESVRFGVSDNALNDNLGGMSLRIDPIAGCSNPAAMSTYGTGTNGIAGIPDLDGSSMPFHGDSSFELRLDSAAPTSVMGWLIGWGQGNVPLANFGANLLVQPLAYSVVGVTDASGASALPVPLHCDPALLCGLRITCQAAVLDAAATGGIAFSNGVDVTIGS